MDTSLELLSSMSPKINRNKKPLKNTPTILALKKHIRRSSAMGSPKKDESIITIESRSTSTSENSSNESPILISDISEASSVSDSKSASYNSPLKKKKNKNWKNKQNSMDRLSQEKFSKIKHWVEEVNCAKKNTSIFSEVSTICGEDNPRFKAPSTGTAANSTFSKATSTRFDELFKNHHLNKNEEESIKKISENADVVIGDSLITEDNSFENDHNSLTDNFKDMVLDDSFDQDLNESLTTRIKKKQTTINPEFETPPSKDPDEYEDLLDSIYGNSWRQGKDVLSSSEPQFKRKETKTSHKVNTERPTKAINIRKNPYLPDGNESNDLLKNLQKARFKKALESPWMKSLKNICDSDTDVESSDNFNLPPTKLDFAEHSDNLADQRISSELPSLNKTKTKSSKVVNLTRKVEESSKEIEPYSFLASLSSIVPVSKSDVTALIYRNNFKQHREQLASKLFKLYNQNIFDDAIPSDTPLEWNDRMRGTAGYCYCRKITRKTGAIERAVRIVISSKVVDSADRLRDTLVHEMCHAVTWIVNQVTDGHGSFWRSWADRAMKVFPELPPIKRCHQYVINTKYTYRCVNCGYSIGRHTKSLDVERKRCGHCYGKFEILINKVTKKGETKTVPVTPKKVPTGFALFVKENYATYKAPGLKHADVMKMLGQKFSNLKIDTPNIK